ncbi:MAG: hypothetical protein ACE5DI_01895 [Candidatus Micrarchaeia archaeon]
MKRVFNKGIVAHFLPGEKPLSRVVPGALSSRSLASTEFLRVFKSQKPSVELSTKLKTTFGGEPKFNAEVKLMFPELIPVEELNALRAKFANYNSRVFLQPYAHKSSIVLNREISSAELRKLYFLLEHLGRRTYLQPALAHFTPKNSLYRLVQ